MRSNLPLLQDSIDVPVSKLYIEGELRRPLSSVYTPQRQLVFGEPLTVSLLKCLLTFTNEQSSLQDRIFEIPLNSDVFLFRLHRNAHISVQSFVESDLNCLYLRPLVRIEEALV